MTSVNAAMFWLNKNCVRHPRISGGVAVLLRYLNEWLREHGQDQCSHDEFVTLLEAQQLEVIAVSGISLVVGFGLKHDWDFILRNRKSYGNQS
jgi:hypothetical protein